MARCRSAQSRRLDGFQGGPFVLLLPQEKHAQVNHILDLTQLHRAFASVTSIEEGLRAARAGRASRLPGKAA